MKLSQQYKVVLNAFINEDVICSTAFLNSETEQDMFQESFDAELNTFPIGLRNEEALLAAMHYMTCFRTDELDGCWDDIEELSRQYAEKVLDDEQQGTQSAEWHKENMPEFIKDCDNYTEEYKSISMLNFFTQMRKMQMGLLSLLAQFSATIK